MSDDVIHFNEDQAIRALTDEVWTRRSGDLITHHSLTPAAVDQLLTPLSGAVRRTLNVRTERSTVAPEDDGMHLVINARSAEQFFAGRGLRLSIEEGERAAGR